MTFLNHLSTAQKYPENHFAPIYDQMVPSTILPRFMTKWYQNEDACDLEKWCMIEHFEHKKHEFYVGGRETVTAVL
jgi:hypothetical protein